MRSEKRGAWVITCCLREMFPRRHAFRPSRSSQVRRPVPSAGKASIKPEWSMTRPGSSKPSVQSGEKAPSRAPTVAGGAPRSRQWLVSQWGVGVSFGGGGVSFLPPCTGQPPDQPSPIHVLGSKLAGGDTWLGSGTRIWGGRCHPQTPSWGENSLKKR